MTERPMLFNAESVGAILSDQKSQTRRVVKPQPILGKPWKHGWIVDPNEINLPIAFCPYGIVGDHLWVRETWRQGGGGGNLNGSDEYALVQYRASATTRWERDETITEYVSKKMCPPDGVNHSKSGPKWRPSIFMPRWASRIDLQIVSVKGEWIQDISCGGYLYRSDVQKEGCPFVNKPDQMGLDEIGWFREVWDKINAKRGFGWDANPYVWAIEFVRLRR